MSTLHKVKHQEKVASETALKSTSPEATSDEVKFRADATAILSWYVLTFGRKHNVHTRIFFEDGVE